MWGALHHGARVVGPRGVARRHALATIGRENKHAEETNFGPPKNPFKMYNTVRFQPLPGPKGTGDLQTGGDGRVYSPPTPPSRSNAVPKAYIPGRRTALPRWWAGALVRPSELIAMTEIDPFRVVKTRSL